MNSRSFFYVEKWPGVDFRWGSLFVVTQADDAYSSGLPVLFHLVLVYILLVENTKTEVDRILDKLITLLLDFWNYRIWQYMRTFPKSICNGCGILEGGVVIIFAKTFFPDCEFCSSLGTSVLLFLKALLSYMKHLDVLMSDEGFDQVFEYHQSNKLFLLR